MLELREGPRLNLTFPATNRRFRCVYIGLALFTISQKEVYLYPLRIHGWIILIDGDKML